MQIPTEHICNGSHTGDIVWICHYHRPDLQKKPLRNIPPTKCIIVDNDELPKNKKVYYSCNHFRPISKTGKRTSKIISPVDNTGYRFSCGNLLFVFDNESDCIIEWNKQLRSHIGEIDVLIDTVEDHWKNEKINLVDLLKP